MNDIFILIGDSLTFGYGVLKEKSFSYKLSKSLKIPVINKGVNGDTTASILNRIYEDVFISKPKYIFIMAGTNDLLCGRKVETIIDNIEEMIVEGLKITKNIIIGIPPCIIKSLAYKLFSPSDLYDYTDKNLINLKNSLVDLCKKYNINYINLYTITKQYITDNKFNKLEKNNIFIDGIHLNSYGNEIIFDEIIKLLPKNIIK